MTEATTDTILISDFIDNEYRDYSVHTITNRAIPLFIDGLKPVQRKTLYTAIKECATKEVKVSSLGGSLPKIGAYHHGSASAEDAIVKMSQDFNNNVCLLEGSGAFGSRPVPVAAAARYITTKLSENFQLYFNDNEVLPMSLDKDDHPEPLCYLPIIPFSLVNGASGIAVGAATKFLPRNPRDIARACKEYIETGTIKSQLRPYVKGFKGKFKKEPEDGKYTITGLYTRISNGSKLKITEIPLGETHESYKKHLDKLKTDSKIIVNSPDAIIDDTMSDFEFTIKLSKEGKLLTDEQIEKKFKLTSSFKENMTLIVFDDMSKIPDDNTKVSLKTYTSAKDIIKDFVDFRILFVDERISFNIQRCNNEIDDLTNRIKFVESVVDGTFTIKNKTRKQMIDELTKIYNADYAEKFVTISIYSLSKDNIKRLKDKLAEFKKELKYWQTIDSKTLYVEYIDNLIQKIDS